MLSYVTLSNQYMYMNYLIFLSVNIRILPVSEPLAVAKWEFFFSLLISTQSILVWLLYTTVVVSRDYIMLVRAHLQTP